MKRRARGLLAGMTVLVLAAGLCPGQSAGRGVEPGLEKAAGWKWRVVPSPLDRRMVPQPVVTPTPAALSAPQPVFYEVQRGDALAIIARKFGMTSQHLKIHNGLTSDLIRIGQMLKIPSIPEAQAIAPLPKPKSTNRKFLVGGRRQVTDEQMRNAAVQVFLDRQNFSSGPIDGKRSPLFEKVLYLFRLGHPEIVAPGALAEKIGSEVGDGFSRYVLREEDFQFIQPPKAIRVDSSGGTNRDDQAAYKELVDTPHRDYRSPWEFVAERFHCDENFLKSLNFHVPAVPEAGTELIVPKVIPFEIERLGLVPLQPRPDPNRPVRAAIMDLALLQIFEGDALVAVMPVTMARPGLRGRGAWTLLDAVLLPRLGTLQEELDRPRKPKPFYGQPEPEGPAKAPTTLTQEQFLGSGPNNPVGILWVNLAKSGSAEPMIYGLHGTSVPDGSPRPYSLGGIQLTNWDILRAVQRLPVGTTLEWTQAGVPQAITPAVRPAPSP